MRARRLALLAVGALAGTLAAVLLLEDAERGDPLPAPPVPAAPGTLVALGADPRSGLEEVALAGTGRIPARGPDGALAVGADTAVVLVRIPAGRFLRGAHRDPGRPGFDDLAWDHEGPTAEVRVAAFWLAKHETTASQWARLGGEDDVKPSAVPVADLGWTEARERLAAASLRLPSETEWEYACRAGTTTRYSSGDTTEDLARIGWFRDNSRGAVAFVGETGGAVHPVGEKPGNAFGLHDLHGNVAEWCEDRWHRSYRGAPLDGRAWTEGVTAGRIHRGGSWFHGADEPRCAARGVEPPARRRPWLGVRVAR